MAPGATCNLTFTSAGSAVAQTSFTIAGVNTNTVSAQIAVLTIGSEFDGGKVACLDGGLNNLIAATTDNSSSIEWGGFGLTSGALSTTNGASNTISIVRALRNNGGTAYAAKLCNNYEIDSAGNTPCRAGNTCYNDWFLPAQDQLNCLFQNQVAIGGFSDGADGYWSSTELANSNDFAGVQFFIDGFVSDVLKFDLELVRCVRAFTQ